MKYLLISLVVWFYQGNDNTTQEIGTALKAGSSKELIKYCNNTVEIKIEGVSSNYSLSQAEVVLKNFFAKYPPKDFNYIHQKAAPEGLKYNIGEYVHSNGSLRVVMFIKKIGDKFLIDTLYFSEM